MRSTRCLAVLGAVSFLAVAGLLVLPQASGAQRDRKAPGKKGPPKPPEAKAVDPAAVEPLPEGPNGIAARYPGDAGIASDPAVIFADDFEGYADAKGLPAKWNAGVYHDVRIATAAGSVYAGRRALEFLLPKQDKEQSNGVARRVEKEADVLFLRCYTKFDPAFDISGSCHNGIGMSSRYFPGGQATPGVPADGRNKFLAEFECWRGEPPEPSPGRFNAYVYHPGQRSQWGDHFFPDGKVMPNTSLPFDFGKAFKPRPDAVPALGRWICCELMVRANTPGAKDGRIAFWVDGTLAADFPNLRLRDVPDLKIDRFNLSLHARANAGPPARKWYDNVVAATAYIGPVAPPAKKGEGETKGR